MAVAYYWYAWFLMILAYFFLNRNSIKRDVLMVFIAFQMISFSHLNNNHDVSTYTLLGVLSLFGLIFWIEQKKFWYHALPFSFSLLCAGVQLFFLVNPVWSLFPAIQWLLVGVIYIVHKLGFPFYSQVGLWVLVNTLGTLWSTLVLTYYQTSDYMNLIEMNLLIGKGIILLFLLQGIYQIKRSLVKLKRQQRNKRRIYA
ncbi:hypothetical protein [Halobacillus ihumii]|uniref:YphA family membrane protein n=1 Tax=Halobacillus ihumii TaxID=2686092 RepID=UPI0013D62288|nr:hypothetical protein [Halobacillus ihumii]